MNVYPVILCGGAGTRLWPISRPSRPKQFAELLGERSMFRQTLERATAVEGMAGILVLANARHGAAVERQLADENLTATIVLEPVARDSAAAIAAAAAVVHQLDPDGVALILASDHFIPETKDFVAAASIAVEAASAGSIVTFGLKPASPSTAYGYIKPGEPSGGVFRIARFAEKPDAATAATFVEEGYLWNSGMFVAKASVLIAEFEAFAPEVLASAKAAVEGAERAGRVLTLGEAFRTAPKISFDFAVMEHTTRAEVVPSAMAWSDLGAWDAVWDAAEKDADGVVALGDVITVDTRDSYVSSAGGSVVTVLGGRNLAVIVERDAVLVCDMANAQGVKTIVGRLADRGRGEVDFPPRQPAQAVDPKALWTWLNATALPLWCTLGADHENGGYHELLDLDGRPTPSDRRCRVQARQAYVYATAGAWGWGGPWRRAVDQGLDYLSRAYRREDGFYRSLVGPDGAVVSDSATLYDQAFVLLALAGAHRASPERRDVVAEGERLIRAVSDWRAPSEEGFREPGRTLFEATAHMHLFEAALAWIEAGVEAPWRDLAASLAELCLSRFVGPDGSVGEAFADDWSRVAEPDGATLNPGYVFEWAWLLARWSRLSGDAAVLERGRAIYAAAARGIDPSRDMAVDRFRPADALGDLSARLWPQTERLKAAVILGAHDDARRAAGALWGFLQTSTPGLWRDRSTARAAFVEEPAPASSLYHLAIAIRDFHAAYA